MDVPIALSRGPPASSGLSTGAVYEPPQHQYSLIATGQQPKCRRGRLADRTRLPAPAAQEVHRLLACRQHHGVCDTHRPCRTTTRLIYTRTTFIPTFCVFSLRHNGFGVSGHRNHLRLPNVTGSSRGLAQPDARPS